VEKYDKILKKFKIKKKNIKEIFALYTLYHMGKKLKSESIITYTYNDFFSIKYEEIQERKDALKNLKYSLSEKDYIYVYMFYMSPFSDNILEYYQINTLVNYENLLEIIEGAKGGNNSYIDLIKYSNGITKTIMIHEFPEIEQFLNQIEKSYQNSKL